MRRKAESMKESLEDKSRMLNARTGENEQLIRNAGITITCCILFNCHH